MQSERINLSANELTHRVRGHFKLDSQREVFDAAVKGFDNEDSPLRLKSFALALRELARISHEQLAPKEKIIACEWFEQNTDLREEDGVTRAQRVKYAVQGELPDEFVLEDLHIDVQSTMRECLALIDALGKYGQNVEESIDNTEKAAELESIRALGTFDQLSRLIQEKHDSLLSSAADFAKETTSLECGLFDVDNVEPNSLSMYVLCEDVHLDSLSILSLHPDWILFQGRGRVYARLQYGPISVVELDKSEVIYDIYPFECRFDSDTRCQNPTFVHGSMKIDTDSFYDDGQG